MKLHLLLHLLLATVLGAVTALQPGDAAKADGEYSLPPLRAGAAYTWSLSGSFGGGSATPGYLDAAGNFASLGRTFTAAGSVTKILPESAAAGQGRPAVSLSGATSPALVLTVTKADAAQADLDNAAVAAAIAEDPAAVRAAAVVDAGFSPLALNPSFWLDSHQLELADGSSITSLVDKSGNHRTIANSGTAPTFEASGPGAKPWILSPARTLITSSFQHWPSKRGTWFVVYRPDGLVDQKRVLGSFQGGSGTTWVIYNNDDADDRAFYSGAFGNSYLRLQGDAAEDIIIRTVRRDSDTAYRWYRNATMQWDFTLADHATTSNPLRIGQEMVGRIGEVIGFDEALSDADTLRVQRYLTKKWTGSEPINLVFEGDSQTSGQGITANGDTYPGQVQTLMATDAAAYVNRGVSSSTWATLTSRAATLDLSLSTGANNILAVWCGTNDSHADANVTIAAATTYLAARKAAGWKKIIVLTAMDRADTSDETWRTAYNTGLRALCTAEGYLCADVAADASIGAAGAYSNTTYFSVDGVHLNVAGAAIVAGLVKTQIDKLIP